MPTPPNRIAVYLVAAASLLTALAPAVADLDPTSTASLVAGLVGLVLIATKWLTGWQQHEESQRWQDHERFMQELKTDD
jgi:hypothetical protein